MEIGMRIKKKREAMGMDQFELARKAGVSRALVARLETGRYRHLTGKKVVAVKRVLKVRFRGLAKKPQAKRVVRARMTDTDRILRALTDMSTRLRRLEARVAMMMRAKPAEKPIPEPASPIPETLAA
jgi:transcriptional regulator with XRE-family HTH domain